MHMTLQRHRIITFAIGLALTVWAGKFAASDAQSSSPDQAAALADAITQQFAPAQLTALIAVAAGRTPAGNDEMASSLERMQHTLDVDKAAAVALLRIFDQRDDSERSAKDLAQATVLYHAVVGDLSAITLNEPGGQHIIDQARTAMSAGQFDKAEARIHQFEDIEVRNADRPGDHQFTAAQARTWLGKIALMKLEYGKATEDFQLARQRLAMAHLAPSGATQTQPIDAANAPEPASEKAAETIAPGDGQPLKSEPRPSLPQRDPEEPQPSPPSVEQANSTAPPKQDVRDGATTVTSIPVVAALTAPDAAATAASREPPKTEATPPVTEAVVRPAVAARTLPPEMLELLLRRGDALLTLGDLAAARLLFERAAEAGDARGATGAGKTYDPGVLSEIGARGIQADPAAAATWYRKALSLGDASAAARLRQLGQANTR